MNHEPFSPLQVVPPLNPPPGLAASPPCPRPPLVKRPPAPSSCRRPPPRAPPEASAGHRPFPRHFRSVKVFFFFFNTLHDMYSILTHLYVVWLFLNCLFHFSSVFQISARPSSMPARAPPIHQPGSPADHHHRRPATSLSNHPSPPAHATASG